MKWGADSNLSGTSVDAVENQRKFDRAILFPNKRTGELHTTLRGTNEPCSEVSWQ